MSVLRISTPEQEGQYQGSKFLKYQILCDADELKELFDQISPFFIFHLTGLGSGEPISKEFFLKQYSSWIELLKRGEIPTDKDLRTVLAAAFTTELEALWKQKVPGGRFAVKIAKPIVQLQAHHFTFSRVDGVFRPMTMGPESIFWGIQFSFPQIYQDPKTMELLEADDSVNAKLFQKIKLWVRESSRATPFIVDEQRTNVPIRIGKNCFSWIRSHAQLQKQQIGIYA